MQTNIEVTFKNGVCTLNAELFRAGVPIASGSTDKSGTITLDTQTDDSILITGVCTGSATVEIAIPTVPPTPSTYPAGKIYDNFLI